MPKRTSKKKLQDENEIAASIISQVTEPQKLAKNPAAVVLGRLGGKKGGVARAKALSAKRRKEIAQKAAIKRWSKRKP
ncbi:MAG: hypothetical protein MJA29_06990 [Candidatus Omnitrophica bacterium]|nr:hypothetical protein [Candidatus Omnitrophota bacterium]